MRIDPTNLLSGPAPDKGVATAAEGESDGGFPAAILRMAEDMDFPLEALSILVASPDGKAMLERIARFGETAGEVLSEAVPEPIPEEEAQAILPGEIPGIFTEGPKTERQPESAETETELRPGYSKDRLRDLERPPALPENPAPPAHPPERTDAVPAHGFAAAVAEPPRDPVPASGRTAEADLRTDATVRPAAGAETAPLRPAPAEAPALPAVSAAAEPAELLSRIGEGLRISLREGRSEIRIRLEPPELGQVRVHIVTENGSVTVRMMAEVPAVRDAIENGLNQLREGLETRGFRVDGFETTLSGGGAEERGGFAGFDPGDAPDRGRTADISGKPETPGRPSAPNPIVRTSGGIDYFA
jgi:flagellar hook-length control protein FliK